MVAVAPGELSGVHEGPPTSPVPGEHVRAVIVGANADASTLWEPLPRKTNDAASITTSDSKTPREDQTLLINKPPSRLKRWGKTMERKLENRLRRTPYLTTRNPLGFPSTQSASKYHTDVFYCQGVRKKIARQIFRCFVPAKARPHVNRVPPVALVSPALGASVVSTCDEPQIVRHQVSIKRCKAPQGSQVGASPSPACRPRASLRRFRPAWPRPFLHCLQSHRIALC